MKLLKNFSANSAQLLLNQLCGLAIFFVLSNNLSKNEFGQLNLALAILLTAFNVLSFGIDPIVVRKIAAGEDSSGILSTYIGHVLVAGNCFYAVLIALHYFFPAKTIFLPVLLVIGFGKLLIFFSSPFKQIASGKEQFKVLAYMSIVSNFLRAGTLLSMAFLHSISLPAVIFIFISGDVAELALCIYFSVVILKVPFKLNWNLSAYRTLLKESLPQIGVVIFSSLMARFDWIFIGLYLSSLKLAEYSFAYKIFELCTLPLLAIAPLLLPWFTRVLENEGSQHLWLRNLLKYELIVATYTALLLYLCWTPSVDLLTGGKYGAVNTHTIFWLALSIPLLYMNNFLWTICFAKRKTKFIFLVIGITCLALLAGDAILIQFYENEGAAMAFMGAMFLQAGLYSFNAEVKPVRRAWISLIICVTAALIAGLVSEQLFDNKINVMLCGSFVFFILLILTRQIKFSDKRCLQATFSHSAT